MRSADTRRLPHAGEEPTGDALERAPPVVVRRVAVGEDGDRDPAAVALDQRPLVDEPSAPAALEQHAPAAAAQGVRDAPALRVVDALEQAARVRPVARRDEPVDGAEE